jgi:hypothetical protein
MVFQRSLTELDASARALTNERSGTRDAKEFRETTKREQAANVQWMKAAIKAAENLVKLSELEPLARPETAEERLEQERQAVSNWLVFQRHDAEQTGRVPKSDNLHQHVQAALEALIGPEGREAPPPERAMSEPRNSARIRRPPPPLLHLLQPTRAKPVCATVITVIIYGHMSPVAARQR